MSTTKINYACGYCGLPAVDTPDGATVHGDGTPDVPSASPGDFVTATHRPGTRIMSYDLVEANDIKITEDMAHVLLDALSSHDNALNAGAQPWADHDGNGDDPKLTEIGYLNLMRLSRAAVTAILERRTGGAA